MLQRLGPIGISAILCGMFLVAIVIGFAATSGGGGDKGATASTQGPLTPLAQTGATGDAIACPGGGQAETYFSQVGAEFRIVGRLASIDTAANQLLVKGPERYVKLNLATDAKIEGALAGGQVIKVSGSFDQNGEAEATEVTSACSAPVAVENVTPLPTIAPTETPAPAPAVVEAALAPQPTPRPVAAAPTRKPVVAPAASAPTARPTRTPEDNRAQPAGQNESHGKKPKHDKHNDHDKDE